MDDKKIQKALDILLQQQATTHAEGLETKEQQKEHEKRINRLERTPLISTTQQSNMASTLLNKAKKSLR